MPPELSIVIPARNDADALSRTLEHLAGLPGMDAVEVIVSASGDREGTARVVDEAARRRPASPLAPDRGAASAPASPRLLWPSGSTRAELMNAGAAAARGRVLLFLHADTLLPGGAVRGVLDALADPGVVGGAFAHRFTESHPSLRVISFVDRVRYRLTGNHYGDQAIFVRRDVFAALGGYAPLGLMEDLDLSRRLKRRGRVVLLPEPVRTSGRRFLDRGPWRTFGFIVWLLLLYTARLDTERYAVRWRRQGERAAPPSAAR